MGQPLLLLLLVHAYIPASWGLRCLQCKNMKSCSVEECAPGQDLCRTTVLRVWEGPDATVPRNRYLECASCASTDLSCERGWDQSLQCRNSGEKCVDVITHQSLKESPGDERHVRGCGILPGCPGPTGFHNNHTFHFLQCCNTTKCNVGPVLELQNLPPNGLQCYSCEGNSTHECSSEETFLIDCRGPMNQCLEATGTKGLRSPHYTIRGCAAPSWCQSLHVAEAFDLTHVNVSCCTGNGCNHPARDTQPRKGGAPQTSPAHLSFFVSLLLTARLWGATLLCT